MKRGDSESKRWWNTPALERWLDSLPDEAPKSLPKPLKLVISGTPPRTAKNSPQLFSNVTESFLRDFIVKWEAYRPPRPIHSEAEIVEYIRNGEFQLPRPTMLPSESYRDWHHFATKAVLPVLENLRSYLPVHYPVHLMCRVYRDAERGDLYGYEQGVADWLEHTGVLVNDRLVQSSDGTRLYKDADNPRVEIYVSPFSREGSTGLFERPAKEWAAHEEPVPEDCVEADEPDTKPFRPWRDGDSERLANEAREMLEQRDPPEAAGSRLTLFTRYGGTR